MTIEGAVDTEIEIDPGHETRADPDETSKRDLATRFAYPECLAQELKTAVLVTA